MKIRNAQIAASAAFALVIAAGSAAFAQQPAAPAAAAPAPQLTGPAIAGLCVFSQDNAIAGSKLGQYIGQRLQTIGKQTEAELQGTVSALQVDFKTTEDSKAALAQTAYEQKQLEFKQRSDALQRLGAQREREIQLTQNKALQRFVLEVQPVFDLTSKERNCSVVLNGEAVYNVGDQMDITQAVVAKLDAKITEFAFDRERIDQQLAAQGQPGGAPPAAARPAATAPRPAASQPARQQPRSGGR
jgi:outer membrane protein